MTSMTKNIHRQRHEESLHPLYDMLYTTSCIIRQNYLYKLLFFENKNKKVL